MSNVATLEPRQTLSTGHKISPIVPTTYAETAALAQTIYASGLAPKGFDSPQKIAVAIMLGAELGLAPMMAINKIAVVNGRPAPFGDAVVAIVRRSGLCEFIDERIEGQGDDRLAICETKRKGETRPVVRMFSVADAKKARLWGKAGPWQDYPERMLTMRARSFALRDTFADLLAGAYDAEEAADIPPEKPRYEPAAPVEPIALVEHIPEPVEISPLSQLLASMGKTESLASWSLENAKTISTLSNEEKVELRKAYRDRAENLNKETE